MADPNAAMTLRQVAQFVVELQTQRPGRPVDRRVLAHRVTGNPHALDDDQPASAMVITVLATLGLVDQNSRTRSTWAQVGVHFDGITGGLSMIGIAPAGWTIPAGSPVTVPPHVLAGCEWSGPATTTTKQLFVTENPSVLTACLDKPSVRMICTSGKPSALVVETLATLDATGWELLIRADFDDTGLTSVNTILGSCPTARPWRMSADDYLHAVSTGSTIPLRGRLLPEATWDPQLKPSMLANGHAAFEEADLDQLVTDATALP